MSDRALIIDALRDYEAKMTRLADDPARPPYAASRRRHAEDALRIRAELEDNSDYVVRGGL